MVNHAPLRRRLPVLGLPFLGWHVLLLGILLAATSLVMSPRVTQAQPSAASNPSVAADEGPVTAEQIVSIARLREEGRPAEALPAALQAWERAQRLPTRPIELNETLLILIGRIHSDLKAPDKAEPFFVAALEAAQARLGPNSARLDAPLYFRAGNLVAQGQLAQAEPHYLRLLALYEAGRGPRHVDLVEPLRALARLRRLQGRASEARTLVLRALDLWQSPSAVVFGVRFDGSDHDLQNLAALHGDAGEFAQAEALYRKALLRIDADLKEGTARFGRPGNGVLSRQADCLSRLATVLERQGQTVQAVRVRAQADEARGQIRAEPLSRPDLWGLNVFDLAR